MSSTKFDIAIIGAGAAGLQLATALQGDPFFSDKKILLLEKDSKEQNDHTWCFWEKGEGQWDGLLRHSWGKGDYFSKEKSRSLELQPYRYKMLRAIDFYAFAKQEIATAPNISWQNDEVLDVENGTEIRIKGKQGDYQATHVFDSRIPQAFFQKKDPYTRLIQHFKGWVIRTTDDRFDPSRFTMMDYRLQWEQTTSFTYLLPMNRREAMVEFTLFSPELIADQDYDTMLRRYLGEILLLPQYEVLEVEQGVIPMSDFPFEEHSVGNHIRIGTAGGWVKPSSGYSFKNCERNTRRIVGNLKAGRPANQGIISPRFRLYDTLFLDVLYRRNDFGPALFDHMYFKNDIQKIFAFLDEESSFGDDLKMMAKFPPLPFLCAIINTLTR